MVMLLRFYRRSEDRMKLGKRERLARREQWAKQGITWGPFREGTYGASHGLNPDRKDHADTAHLLNETCKHLRDKPERVINGKTVDGKPFTTGYRKPPQNSVGQGKFKEYRNQLTPLGNKRPVRVLEPLPEKKFVPSYKLIKKT